MHRKIRAELIRKLEKLFGESLSVLRVNGCASIICFRKHLPQIFKLVNADDNDDIIELSKKIKTEVMTKSPRTVEVYKLADFTFAKAEDSCSERKFAMLYFKTSFQRCNYEEVFVLDPVHTKFDYKVFQPNNTRSCS